MSATGAGHEVTEVIASPGFPWASSMAFSYPTQDKLEHSVPAWHGVLDFALDRVMEKCHLNYRNENP